MLLLSGVNTLTTHPPAAFPAPSAALSGKVLSPFLRNPFIRAFDTIIPSPDGKIIFYRIVIFILLIVSTYRFLSFKLSCRRVIGVWMWLFDKKLLLLFKLYKVTFSLLLWLIFDKKISNIWFEDWKLCTNNYNILKWYLEFKLSSLLVPFLSLRKSVKALDDMGKVCSCNGPYIRLWMINWCGIFSCLKIEEMYSVVSSYSPTWKGYLRQFISFLFCVSLICCVECLWVAEGMPEKVSRRHKMPIKFFRFEKIYL